MLRKFFPSAPLDSAWEQLQFLQHRAYATPLSASSHYFAVARHGPCCTLRLRNMAQMVRAVSLQDYLRRRSQDFPSVEPHLLNIFVACRAKVRALREVLPHQAVGVLIQAALPRMERRKRNLRQVRHACGLRTPLSDVIVWTNSAPEPSRRIMTELTVSFCPPSKVYFVARSTSDSSTVSFADDGSQSPTRSFASAGRSEMSTRPEWHPPFQFGFLPRRRSFKTPPALRSSAIMNPFTALQSKTAAARSPPAAFSELQPEASTARKQTRLPCVSAILCACL